MTALKYEIYIVKSMKLLLESLPNIKQEKKALVSFIRLLSKLYHVIHRVKENRTLCPTELLL